MPVPTPFAEIEDRVIAAWIATWGGRVVGMYANDWTLDYKARGREAVELLLDRGVKAGIITRDVHVVFVDD